jgi:competence protein ComEA
MPSSRIRSRLLAVLVCLGSAMVLFAEATEPAQAGKVNINTATAAELSYLPRLGARVASRVIEHRKEKPFARPEDLMEVKGIGEKLFVTLKPYVSVSGPTTLTSKVRSSAAPRRSSSPAKEKAASAVPVGKGR